MKQKLEKSKEESKMRNTVKGGNGITLIALVITIIVLLILAGVTIAMLSGENGILSRATETRATNAEAQADEQAKLAYMGVRTEIIAERVSNASYNAQANAGKLGKMVKSELTGDKWTVNLGENEVTTSTADGANATEITMTFTDSSLSTTNHEIKYTIKLPVAGGTTVTLLKNGKEMTSGGGNEEDTPTTSAVVFKNGTETVTTPAVGNDVEIGAEKFKVIKISADGKTVTAMPYYNLVLSASPIKQATEDYYREAGTVAFATSSTWNANENIDLDVHSNNVKTPIANYETYLKSLGASNVIARIGREYPTTQAGATITEAEYIGNLSGQLNPSRKGNFWLGSSVSTSASYVCGVAFTRRHLQRRVLRLRLLRWCSSCNNNQHAINQKETKSLARSKFLEETAPANGAGGGRNPTLYFCAKILYNRKQIGADINANSVSWELLQSRRTKNNRWKIYFCMIPRR